MTDEKINSTANNIQIDIDNLSYVNYLWTQRISETSIQGIRLDKRNLPTDTVYSSSLNSKVNKSGDTMTGKLTVQSGDASGCLQIGADVASNTLTAGTRKLARMTFPTREYGTTKTCSIMSCDNMNNYNYVEFGGHIGDATNTAPDYMCFNVDKTHNSLSPATKECVMAISPTSLRLFNGAVDAGQITSFDSISGKWVFNNSNTFKNSGYTYTLPNKTGTIALTSNIPIKVSQLENDSRFTSNIGTITEIKVNGTSKGTSGSVNLTNMVTFASSQTTTVAGTNKTTYTYNQPTGDSDTGSSNGSAYFPEGIIMGGTAASAGLVTRGICGVTTPNATTGACDKENLYINYDGNNDYQSNRQLVIQAGSVGTHYGNNLYQYAAARGDAVKGYCDHTYIAKSAIGAKNGVASLDNTGKVPSSQLPSYVDDVIDGYYYNSKFYKESSHTTAITNESGKIYIDLTTNKIYRWNGNTYVEISASLALGETKSTAYAGDKGKANATNIAINTKNISTLQDYFDANGYAKVAVVARNDVAGNDIMVTYATKKYVGDNFVKKTYEYKSGTVVDEIFTFKSTSVVTSLTYKEYIDLENNTLKDLSGIYISLKGVQFLAPSLFQVKYSVDGDYYDVLTTNNMVAITTSEINDICK